MVRPDLTPLAVVDPRELVERLLRTALPAEPSPEVWRRILRSLELDERLN